MIITVVPTDDPGVVRDSLPDGVLSPPTEISIDSALKSYIRRLLIHGIYIFYPIKHYDSPQRLIRYNKDS